MASYVPILTRTAVAPPGSVPAGTICVSPTGSPSGDGSPANPYDFVTGNDALTDGGTLLLFDGIYQLAVPPTLTYFGKDGQTLQTTVKAQTGARPILTAINGSVIFPRLRRRTTVDGLWFGGTRGNDGELQNENDCIVQSCTFFNHMEAINDGETARNQYLNNRFVNNGNHPYQHDLYINNTNVAPGDGAVVRGGIHVGGEAWKIHLWHEPKYATIQKNLCAAPGYHEFVIQGDRHTIDRNVAWYRGINFADLPTNATVTKNATGPWAILVNALGAGSTSDGNIMTDPNGDWGTNPTHWTQAQWKTTTGYSVAEIDDTVSQLISAFQQSVANIWIDNGIEPLFAILAAVRDAVAGPDPQQDSPPPVAQAETIRSSRRGGIPLSHRHKGGRNRLGFTRSRRLTIR